MFKYLCKECGGNMQHKHNSEVQMRKDEDSGRVFNMRSLGTWGCPKCGGKKVKRVKKGNENGTEV